MTFADNFRKSLSVAYRKKALSAALRQWVQFSIGQQKERDQYMASRGSPVPKSFALASCRLTRHLARQARPYLSAFLRDNRHLTAEQLEELASHLSPGSFHNGAFLARIIRAKVPFVDQLLMVALYRYTWHGGKAGFQFLPDPAETDLDEYETEVWELMELLDNGTNGDPRRILTGDDLAFFDSLPDVFTIYRGAMGITDAQAGAGVCWTTRREVAEWFAMRGKDPIVLTAKCRKPDVRLAKASEFEVVTVARKPRAIACRPHKDNWRPEMDWAKVSRLRQVCAGTVPAVA